MSLGLIAELSMLCVCSNCKEVVFDNSKMRSVDLSLSLSVNDGDRDGDP